MGRVSDLGDVILTRELERDGTRVLVQIGRPMPFAAGESDHYVPFRIGDGPVMIAAGIDGVQALIFALAMIGDLLKGEGMTFIGSTDPGFPVTVPEEGMYVATLRVPLDPSLLEGSA